MHRAPPRTVDFAFRHAVMLVIVRRIGSLRRWNGWLRIRHTDDEEDMGTGIAAVIAVHIVWITARCESELSTKNVDRHADCGQVGGIVRPFDHIPRFSLDKIAKSCIVTEPRPTGARTRAKGTP